jgi:hypothetical protein
LDHAVSSDEQFGVRIHGKPLEQRLQFGPQPVAAQGGDRVEFAEGWHVPKLLAVC